MHFENFTGGNGHEGMGADGGDGAPPTIACEERARQREIYAYLTAASYLPKLASGHPSYGQCHMNPDNTLNQLVQLGPLRLGYDRAILSFVDHRHEYTVAESTREHTPAHKRAASNPELIVGVAKIPHEDGVGICTHVVDAFNDETGDSEQHGPHIYANAERYFITDLRKEELYRNKPCVGEEKPRILSFLSVPIISPLGYVLGSYMVGDSRVNHFSQDDVDTMQEISVAIMDHLDLIQSRQNRGRSERLMKGLAEFMERESPAPQERTMSMSTRATSERTESVHAIDGEDDTEPGSQPWRPGPHTTNSTSTVLTANSSDAVFSPMEPTTNHSTPPSTPSDESRDPLDTAGVDAPLERQGTVEEQPAPPPPETTVSEEVRKTLKRAAAIICEAMNMDGLVFCDAVPSSFGSRSNTHTPYAEKDVDPFISDTADSTSNDPDMEICSRYLAKYINPVTNKPEETSDDGYCPIPESLMQRWIRRFPRGHVFSADEFGPIDCRYGPGHSLEKSKKQLRRSSRLFNDVAGLFDHFPEVRYVIFLPLWHFQRECWFAAAFGWVTFESAQTLNLSDINLLTAFSNSVMIEVSRIEALSISRAKSDFISSISHELRSPLHGILASGELLREALEDPSLLSMIDMIDSCGTTLLDTFNNLLDHAKINNVAQADKVDGDAHHKRRIRKAETKIVDLSLLVQDTCEAVNLGHLSKTAFQQSHQPQAVFTTLAELAEAEDEVPDHSVIITMNIEKRPSWQTKIDPGAWNRIVMNVVGNALKYTRAGHIDVGLKIADVVDDKRLGAHQRCICFSVRDTGIGMSADYLKYQLFTPFAQENNLSPGTGLGLSIVNQIVKGMNGKLDVQSQIGVGTHIKIFVPLHPDTAGPLGQHMPPIDEVSNFDADGKLRGRKLHVITPEAYKAMSNPDLEITEEMRQRARAVRSALRHIAADSFGMKVIYDMPEANSPADMYFFDAYILGKAMHGRLNCNMPGAILQFSPLIVLCSGAGSLHQLLDEKLKGRMLHLRHPIGPKKLGRALLNALEVGRSDAHSFGLNAVSGASGEAGIAAHPVGSVKRSVAQPVKNEDSASLAKREDSTGVVTKEELATHVKNEHSSTHVRPDRPKRPEATHIQHPPVEANKIPSPSALAVTSGNAHRQRHLLLVDDNPINLRILTTLITKLKHTFETATNGLEAVQLFKTALLANKPFDLVLMDISMPVMDGFAATREIRKIEREERGASRTPASPVASAPAPVWTDDAGPPATDVVHGEPQPPKDAPPEALPPGPTGSYTPAKIAALTGLGSAESRLEAFASGTNLFLVKPVKLGEIRGLLAD